MDISKSYELHFPLATVYEAWVSSNTVIAPATAMDINPVVGGHYKLIAATPEFTSHNEGRFSVVEPEQRLTYSWQWNGDTEQREIDVCFFATHNGTLIELTHTGFDSEASKNNHDSGWDSYISGFKLHLMRTFLLGVPKAELHVHLEGTFEPEHIYDMAQTNGIDLGYESPETILNAYNFHDLPSFLGFYYKAMAALQTEQDFYDLTYAYFQKAADENIVYVEPFFDPQGHTSRGISFDTVINGIHRAQIDAKEKLGVESNLIMCFLRDLSAESAMEHLEMSLPYKHWIIGVGLDSDEKDNPPLKFKAVFERARSEGFKLTMHCDVNQKDIISHLWECVNDILVDRIDHGINALEDPALCHVIKEKSLGLTVCPVSNNFVVQTYTTEEIRRMLALGIKATINSDDPAYLTDNFLALFEHGEFSQTELIQLAENAFEISWLGAEAKAQYKTQLQRYVKAV